MWCKVCISYEPSYKSNGEAEIQFAVRYTFKPNESALTNVVPTLISPTLYGLLYSVVMFLQQRTNNTRTNNPINQGVDMYSHDVVNVVFEDDDDVVVVVVVVVVDDLELLQR